MPVLSIEIKVNGQPVGTVSAYRGADQMSYPASFEYPYQASFFPLALRGGVRTYEGKVTHVYNDGMEQLAAKILADIAQTAH